MKVEASGCDWFAMVENILFYGLLVCWFTLVCLEDISLESSVVKCTRNFSALPEWKIQLSHLVSELKVRSGGREAPRYIHCLSLIGEKVGKGRFWVPMPSE